VLKDKNFSGETHVERPRQHVAARIGAADSRNATALFGGGECSSALKGEKLLGGGGEKKTGASEATVCHCRKKRVPRRSRGAMEPGVSQKTSIERKGGTTARLLMEKRKGAMPQIPRKGRLWKKEAGVGGQARSSQGKIGMHDP